MDCGFRSPVVREATLGNLDPAAIHVASTSGQIVLFWGFFLVATPLAIAALERRWAVALLFPSLAGPVGVAVLVLASALILQSWLVVAYAVVGSLVWNYVVRPLEESDLKERFGDEFQQYRDTVRCWVPQVSKTQRSPGRWLSDGTRRCHRKR